MADRFATGENVWLVGHPDPAYRHRAGRVRRARHDREEGEDRYTLQLADGPLLEVPGRWLTRAVAATE